MQFYLLLIYCLTAILNCYRSNKTCFVHFSLSADSFLHLMLPLPAMTALLFHGTATRIMIMHAWASFFNHVLHKLLHRTECWNVPLASQAAVLEKGHLTVVNWKGGKRKPMWKISEGKKRGEREEHKGIHPPPYSCVPLTLCTWRKGNIPDLPEIFQRSLHLPTSVQESQIYTQDPDIKSLHGTQPVSS
jgi:hypothetical protein